jgi:acid phosphatase
MKILAAAIFISILAACAHTVHEHGNDHADDLGLYWVKYAAEYQAISAQVYAQATRDLPRFIADTSWTALPDQPADPRLPPAVILDIDETVVSNVDFQLTFERPFANHKLDTWSSSVNATPVRGVVEFVKAARAAGATVFFVTNRPCQPVPGNDAFCPQKQTTVDDVRELGIDVEPEYVMLADEKPEWDREKLTRRQHVAKTYRVIMLVGDDLSDFIPCVREEPAGPCTRAGTQANRLDDVERYRKYWGAGWYILPNPMHGSWTSVE